MLQRRPTVYVKCPTDVQTDQAIGAHFRFSCLGVRVERALGPNHSTGQCQVDEEIAEAVVGHVEITDGRTTCHAPSEAIVERELWFFELRDAVFRVLEVKAMVKAADAQLEEKARVGVGTEDGQEFAGVSGERAGAATDGDVCHLALVVDELAGGGQEVGEDARLDEGHAEAPLGLQAPVKSGALLDVKSHTDRAT